MTELIIEMTENEFIHYHSHMIGHVESVTIEEVRECVGEDHYHIEKIKKSKEEGKF